MSNTELPERNAPLLRKVADTIRHQPHLYNQNHWFQHTGDDYIPSVIYNEEQDTTAHRYAAAVQDTGEAHSSTLVPEGICGGGQACIAGHALITAGWFYHPVIGDVHTDNFDPHRPVTYQYVDWQLTDPENPDVLYNQDDSQYQARLLLGLAYGEANLLFEADAIARTYTDDVQAIDEAPHYPLRAAHMADALDAIADGAAVADVVTVIEDY